MKVYKFFQDFESNGFIYLKEIGAKHLIWDGDFFYAVFGY